MAKKYIKQDRAGNSQTIEIPDNIIDFFKKFGIEKSGLFIVPASTKANTNPNRAEPSQLIVLKPEGQGGSLIIDTAEPPGGGAGCGFRTVGGILRWVCSNT